jgi:hypothetical protein
MKKIIVGLMLVGLCFAGNANTEAQQLELTNANWAIQLMSGLRDKGQNITGINNDMAGANRNQGLSADIGAFEKAVLMISDEQNISNLTLKMNFIFTIKLLKNFRKTKFF